MSENPKEFDFLIGKTIASIDRSDSDLIAFTLSDGTRCELYHEQDCCESVTVESIDGTLDSIIGKEIVIAAECELPNGEDPAGYKAAEDSYRDSWTWTIYTLATLDSNVSIRWLGESNGYYSESVNFRVVKATETP